jgi:hypothetical protein
LCTGENLHEKTEQHTVLKHHPGFPRYARPGEPECRTREWKKKRKNPTGNAKEWGADMQPKQPIKGSTAKNPCSHIGFIGTAREDSAATNIKSTDAAGTAGTKNIVKITPLPTEDRDIPVCQAM